MVYSDHASIFTIMEIWRLKYWTHGSGHRKKDGRMESERGMGKGKGKRLKGEGKGKGKKKGMENGKGEEERERERKNEKEKGKEKGKGKRKVKERWKEDSLRNVGRTDARTDTKVILYSVQCYALH